MSTGLEICTDCAQELEHCHGVAIVQEDGSHECSDDPDCQLTIELHLWIANVEG
jgi:hypothetical protein